MTRTRRSPQRPRRTEPGASSLESVSASSARTTCGAERIGIKGWDMLRRLACLAAIPAFACLAPGCSDDAAPSPAPGADDEVSYELFKSTIELDGAALGAISDN